MPVSPQVVASTSHALEGGDVLVRIAAGALKLGTRECGTRRIWHSMVRLQMTITYEYMGKALGVLRRSIQERAVQVGDR